MMTDKLRKNLTVATKQMIQKMAEEIASVQPMSLETNGVIFIDKKNKDDAIEK